MISDSLSISADILLKQCMDEFFIADYYYSNLQYMNFSKEVCVLIININKTQK